MVPIPPVPEGYAAPQCAPHSPNREQVKLVYSTNATMRTREQIMSLFSHNLFEARIIVGTYGTIAESYNLTRAAKAVLFQPDWLTFGEMQAKARIWRCGQRRNVKIYRLLTADSVDIIMAERQAQGAQFNQAVQGIPSDFAETDEDVTEFSEPRVYHEMFPADDTDEI
ncbi:MAG: repair and recombination protein [Pseudonocardiales bacterium]|nr:repair and recombination protein [Pseudonocardiales bacterium]